MKIEWTIRILVVVILSAMLSMVVYGEEGDQEETPVTGPAGPQGLQGPRGPQGFPGQQGQPGWQGPMGLQGYDGANGISGKDGINGKDGAVGPAGVSSVVPAVDPRIDVEIREYDAKHWAVSSYVSFGIQTGTSRYIVGQRLVLKLGKSSEQREIDKLRKEIQDAHLLLQGGKL
jgi:Collagen triple helix repeat (20 copies)